MSSLFWPNHNTSSSPAKRSGVTSRRRSSSPAAECQHSPAARILIHRPTRSSGAFNISWSARWRYKKLAAHPQQQMLIPAGLELRCWEPWAGRCCRAWQKRHSRSRAVSSCHDPVSRAAFGSGAAVRKSGVEHASRLLDAASVFFLTTRRCRWPALHTSLLQPIYEIRSAV